VHQAIISAVSGSEPPRLRKPAHLRFRLNTSLIRDIATLSQITCKRLADWPYWDCTEERLSNRWFTLTGAVRHLKNPDPYWRVRYFLNKSGRQADFHYRALLQPRWVDNAIEVDCQIETFRPFGFWILVILLGPMVPFFWLALAFPLMPVAPGLLVLGLLLYQRQLQDPNPNGKPAQNWRKFRDLTCLALLFPLSIALGFEGRELPSRLFQQVFNAREID